MRPVNLIPEDQRRAGDGASRTGPLAFIVVGALLLLLVGVVMAVLASNQISDRKAEVATLQTRQAAATARAERLAPYANFKLVADQRTQTIASLADSRFDWVRVIRQLSLIVPPQVWLTSMTGSAGGGVGGGEEGEGGGEGASASIAGPSLAMSGCARGQDTVAALVASLKQIDGVTRVGLENSGLPSAEGEVTTGEGGCSGPNMASFSLVVAFDDAPPSPDGAEAVAEEQPAEESSESGSEPDSSSEESASSSTEAPPAG